MPAIRVSACGSCCRRCREGCGPLTFSIWTSWKTLQSHGVRVKVSDISDTLHLPRPGVTRTVKEMEDKGYLRKIASEEDGRVTYLAITDSGKRLSQIHNAQFFAQLAPLLADISDEDAACTVRTIQKLYDVMSERSDSLER